MLRLRLALAFLMVASGIGCTFPQEQMDSKFGDQNFKTSIALIELHHTRTGVYPESLRDLKFVGDWDQIALGAVEYRKLAEGYELNIVRGWVGKPSLAFPPAFWHGLGLRKSNVRSLVGGEATHDSAATNEP
ncbi:MAG TPA: hypothetical protein VGO46_03040 [Gemmatimonadaceae bacterium]|jgi:hypothetical protein|nr:hypothetical protein [Gemmatimonadaceae bacterium]